MFEILLESNILRPVQWVNDFKQSDAYQADESKSPVWTPLYKGHLVVNPNTGEKKMVPSSFTVVHKATPSELA